MNWYGYVGGDPVNLVDVTGLINVEWEPSEKPVSGLIRKLGLEFQFFLFALGSQRLRDAISSEMYSFSDDAPPIGSIERDAQALGPCWPGYGPSVTITDEKSDLADHARGWTTPKDEKINQRGGDVFITEARYWEGGALPTMVHEMGHWIDFQDDELMNRGEVGDLFEELVFGGH
jgi:hypothetical protein